MTDQEEFERNVRIEAKLDILLRYVGGQVAELEAQVLIGKRLDEDRPDFDVQTLERLGFERRYYLCGHPGWPDPLRIWPPTEENARKAFDDHAHPLAYVKMRWEQALTTDPVFIGPRKDDDWERKTLRVVSDAGQEAVFESVEDQWEPVGTYTQPNLFSHPYSARLTGAVGAAFPGWWLTRLEAGNNWAIFDIIRLKEQA